MAGQHVFMPLMVPEAKCAGYQGAEQMHKTSAAENRLLKHRIPRGLGRLCRYAAENDGSREGAG
jgi:hypothetical protein